jgi:hypothetical protein
MPPKMTVIDVVRCLNPLTSDLYSVNFEVNNHPSLAGIDSQPQLPCEIREGQFISSFWDQAALDFSKIDYWGVWDSYEPDVRSHDQFRMRVEENSVGTHVAGEGAGFTC